MINLRESIKISPMTIKYNSYCILPTSRKYILYCKSQKKLAKGLHESILSHTNASFPALSQGLDLQLLVYLLGKSAMS